MLADAVLYEIAITLSRTHGDAILLPGLPHDIIGRHSRIR
jgi:hypothetical protein